ncbi:hypothetical protein [Sphingomonas mesophila]|uniref:hypothetical protein n=1 Tax=Sphingomonas mesophila TaxID=2303576 RepID=UPI000E570DA0|nr:hypothetical protein [Sphingomonas mesophila]
MRQPILIIALAALAAAGCDKKPAAQDVRQADEQLAADNLDSNDLTAIDAASGADANMAADIDIANIAADVEEDGEASTGNRTAPRRPRPAAPRAQPASEPAQPAEPEAANSEATTG